MTLATVIYAANVVVAGWIGVTSLWFPVHARRTVFEDTVAYSETIRLVGALWLAIAVLSVAGLFIPRAMQPVLLFQLIYKATWLVVVALPAFREGLPFPRGMAACFLIWVVILPFAIDWHLRCVAQTG